MKKIVAALLAMLAVLCLTACRQTPDSPIVVGEENNGWKGQEVVAQEIVQPEIPETYESQISEENLIINIDASVEYPHDKPFPIYVTEKGTFAQEQADQIVHALIGDAELLDLSNTRTKQVIQQEIENCTREIENEDVSTELKEIYQEELKDLKIELETAPDHETATPASRELKFKESQDLEHIYGKKVEIEEGVCQYIWTDSARQKAADDGNSQISGYCFLPDGRQKYMEIKNRPAWHSTVQFSDPDESLDDPTALPPIAEEEAIATGNALMRQMNIEYELLGCKSSMGNDSSYILSYCSTVQGTNREDITAAPLDGERAGSNTLGSNTYVKQEEIQMQISGNGIEYFYWEAPVRIVSVDCENVKLLSWEDTINIIEKGLEMKNLWDDRQDEKVMTRQLDIDKICLSYMQIQRDAESFYYVPVWDVIATMHYIYPDDYIPSDGDYVADGNHERIPYENCSVLTVNAIDGSIVTRGWGY